MTLAPSVEDVVHGELLDTSCSLTEATCQHACLGSTAEEKKAMLKVQHMKDLFT